MVLFKARSAVIYAAALGVNRIIKICTGQVQGAKLSDPARAYQGPSSHTFGVFWGCSIALALRGQKTTRKRVFCCFLHASCVSKHQGILVSKEILADLRSTECPVARPCSGGYGNRN
uniref:Uncharacterized protein n=1 Tax=Coccidioides posadasii RMSCC 3488 TaxID=454284 RepID=A0A0J6IM48_COCPO|nr:hypothetical protein CPAG_09296 [Coccidioides posadasii RMSCC 3488]